MPRSRGRRRDRDPAGDERFERMLSGWRRSESKRGHDYTVQPVSAVQAQKEYTCPGCGLIITPGTAHIVVWRADGVMGEAADLAARRHWHNHCWRIA